MADHKAITVTAPQRKAIYVLMVAVLGLGAAFLDRRGRQAVGRRRRPARRRPRQRPGRRPRLRPGQRGLT